jgi:uncharacterized membrane protein YbaN (DUF454 family)
VCPHRSQRWLFLVVPVLPTTPFLILTALCYARGSSRCYRWLVTNRLFGRHLDDYLSGRGVSWKVKAGTLVFLWGVITVSAVLFVHQLWVRVLLFVIAAAVTVHVVTLKSRGRGCRHNPPSQTPRAQDEADRG